METAEIRENIMFTQNEIQRDFKAKMSSVFLNDG